LRSIVEQLVNHQIAAIKCYTNPSNVGTKKPTPEEIRIYIKNMNMRVFNAFVIRMKMEFGYMPIVEALKKFRTERKLKGCHVPIISNVIIEHPYIFDLLEVLETMQESIEKITKSNIYHIGYEYEHETDFGKKYPFLLNRYPDRPKIEIELPYGKMYIVDDTEDWAIDYREKPLKDLKK